jgi:hypothetical protein
MGSVITLPRRIPRAVTFLDLGQNINLSVDYARKLFTDLGRLLILIILDIIPIVGQLIVVGYYAETIRETPSSDSPPKLEKYGGLLIDGLKIAVVAIIYMIIPVILIAFGAVTIFAPYMARPYGPNFWLIPLGFGVILFAAGIILAFAIAIIMAMAIVHMVKMGSFGKAFAVGEIVRTIVKIGWGRYILWLIVMFIFAMIVGGIGSSIPPIGWLISIIIWPIFGVFASRSAALVYTNVETPSTPTVSPPEKKFCMACGAQIPAGATYCPVCGKPQ